MKKFPKEQVNLSQKEEDIIITDALEIFLKFYLKGDTFEYYLHLQFRVEGES